MKVVLRNFCLFLLCIAGLVLPNAGCNRPKNVVLVQELQGHRNYFDELPDWYRKRRIYSDLDVRFYVEVTYLSHPLLEAYVAQYARAYDLSMDEQRNLLTTTMAHVQEEDTFIVSVFAPGKNWDKLDLSDQIWKLRAVYKPNNVEVKPVGIREESLDDPKFDYFFPYAEPWARHYRVRVPAVADATEVTFSMQGVVGSQEFHWSRPR